jgi:hypothetical protein
MDLNLKDLLKPITEEELNQAKNQNLLSPITQDELAYAKIQKELEDKEKETPGYLESFLRGGAQGASFGFADELTGGIEATLDRLPGETLEQAYQRHRDEARDKYKKAQETNPLTFMAGELVGGLLSGSLTGGAGTGASLSRMALSGATQGALYGLGASENLDQAKEEMKTGAITGALGGAVAKGISSLLGSRQAKEASKFFKAGREDIPLVGEAAKKEQMKLGEELYKDVSSAKETIQDTFGKLLGETRKEGTNVLNLPKEEIKQNYNQIVNYIKNNPDSEITTPLKEIKNLFNEFFTVENYKNIKDERIYNKLGNTIKDVLRDPKIELNQTERQILVEKLKNLSDIYSNIDNITPEQSKEIINILNNHIEDIKNIPFLNKSYKSALKNIQDEVNKKDILFKENLSMKEIEEFQKRLRDSFKNVPSFRNNDSKSFEQVQSIVKNMENMVDDLYNQYDKLQNISALKTAKKAYGSAKDINKTISDYLNISENKTYSSGQEIENIVNTINKLSSAGTEAENLLTHTAPREYFGRLLKQERPTLEEGIKLLEQKGLQSEADAIRQSIQKLEQFPQRASTIAERSKMMHELGDYKKPFSISGWLTRLTEDVAYRLGQQRGAEAAAIDAARNLIKASPEIVKTGGRIIPILNQVEPKEIYRLDSPSLSNVSEDLIESNDPTLRAYGSALQEAVKNGDIRKKDSIIFSLLQNPKFRNLLKTKQK